MAQDNYLARTVVIKECFPEVFCHREGTSVLVRSQSNAEKYRSIVEMFMREARSIAKLRHPNIVGVHRVFEDNDTAYMALDLIEGQDLRQFIKGKGQSLDPRQIREILIRLLDAVDMVHRQDLLHRDISPDNILIDKWGNPVLIDFGAAREEASRESRALSALLVVKDGYSPQEFYFAGGKQGPCSDLYALAATFYHLISGDVPANSQTRMAEVASGGVDPCEPLAGRFDEYTPEFLEAIDKAMCVLPKERLQSAQEWADMIAPRRRQTQPMALPEKKADDVLGAVLSKLVSETNEYVRNSKLEDQQSASPVQRKQADIKPVPAWVAEFNAETEEIVHKMGGPKPKSRRAPASEPQSFVHEEPHQGRRLPLMKSRPSRVDPFPVPVLPDRGFAARIWSQVDAIRATWILAVFSLSVVQTEKIIRVAETLLN
ncbi:serine/threonine-protein kinase [Loktanella agnita]|uniref:serine/threonine-protein kinase n=1 Tax=Loktanella agnita TaxID=287097 RepID=UPI003987A540